MSFLLAVIFLGAALYFSLGRMAAHELEQAALLPFADDPEVAQRMSEATGRHCTHVVTPLPEIGEHPPAGRLRA